LVDNVVLTDDGPLWSTFITTPWWMLTGQQHPWPRWLPRAGVSHAAIAQCARFGRALVLALPAIAAGSQGPFLTGLCAVKVNAHTMLAERIGHRSFNLWGRLLRWVGKPQSTARRAVLVVYVLFLLTIILTVLPISMLVTAIAARMSDSVKREAAALEAPSGASSERMGALGDVVDNG
jgi:hypothetical protein